MSDSPPAHSPASGADSEAAALVDTWCKVDHDHAFLPADHDVIEATRPLRGLILEALFRDPGTTERDLLHAFGALGRITAERGGSPTLAAASVDGIVAALRPRELADEVTLPARAAMVESYVHATGIQSREEARRAWAPPACIVGVEDGLIAIAAGHPVDDAEALADWASKVAHAATLSGARRAVVSGSEAAVQALEEALDLAGVARVERGLTASKKPAPARPR